MSTHVSYSMVNHEIVTTDEKGRVIWSGAPLDKQVEDVRQIPGSDDALVLLDYMGEPAGPCRNLVRIQADGQIVWRAELPSSSNTEAYVAVDIDGGLLVAKSWTGYRVILDELTGKIRESNYTK